MISKFIKDCCTEKDGQSYDAVRVLAIIGFCVYNFISLYHTYRHCNDFDPVNYSTGLSIIIGVISASVTYKYTKE